jgi:hypothetical protein
MTPDQIFGIIGLIAGSLLFICVSISVIEKMDCKHCFDIFFRNKPISTDEDCAVVCCCSPCYIVSQIIYFIFQVIELICWGVRALFASPLRGIYKILFSRNHIIDIESPEPGPGDLPGPVTNSLNFVPPTEGIAVFIVVGIPVPVQQEV